MKSDCFSPFFDFLCCHDTWHYWCKNVQGNSFGQTKAQKAIKVKWVYSYSTSQLKWSRLPLSFHSFAVGHKCIIESFTVYLPRSICYAIIISWRSGNSHCIFFFVTHIFGKDSEGSFFFGHEQFGRFEWIKRLSKCLQSVKFLMSWL